MKTNNFLGETFSQVVYDILIGTGFSFALSVTLITASLFTPSPWLTLMYCTATNILVRLITLNKYTTLFVIGTGMLFLGILFFSLYRNDFDSIWYQNLRDLLTELIAFATRSIPYDNIHDELLSLATPILVSMGVACMMRWKLGFYAVTVAGFFIIGIPAYRKWGSSRLAIMIFLATLIVVLYGRFGILAIEGNNKFDKKASSKYLLSLVPLSLLIFLVSWMLPKPDFQPVNLVGTMTGQGGDKVVQEMTFASQNRPMGGPNHQSDTPVMLVSATQPVYLSGLIYDTYSMNRWGLSETGSGELLDRTGNIFEYPFYSSAEIQNQNETLQVFEDPKKTAKIELVGAPTKMIFVPSLPRSIVPDFQEPIFYNVAGEVWTEKTSKKGTTYAQSYYNYDHTNTNFKETLRGLSYGWKVYPEDMNRYLYYPENLPERVIETTKEITRDYDNNYDKLRGIESYLSQFPYTLTPEDTPKDADFIDHFLFEGQEGYCVHYASSMAIMARTIGIPSRYVEGFVMPPQRNQDGKFLVTGKQAHAWVEVYFENLGWIRFEPTPPNDNTIFDTSLLNLEDEPDLEVELETETPELEDPELETNPLEDELLDPLEEKNPFSGFFKILVLVLFLGGLGFVIVKILIYRVDKREVFKDQLPEKESVIEYFKDILSIAGRFGVPLESKETMSVYAKRVEDSDLPNKIKEILDESIPIFVRATYSDCEITTEEKRKLKQNSKIAEKFMKDSEQNKLNYYVRKYFFKR